MLPEASARVLKEYVQPSAESGSHHGLTQRGRREKTLRCSLCVLGGLCGEPVTAALHPGSSQPYLLLAVQRAPCMFLPFTVAVCVAPPAVNVSWSPRSRPSLIGFPPNVPETI